MPAIRCPICDTVFEPADDPVVSLARCPNCGTEMPLPAEDRDLGTDLDRARHEVEAIHEMSQGVPGETLLFRMRTVKATFLRTLWNYVKVVLILVLPLLTIAFVVIWLKKDIGTASMVLGLGSAAVLCLIVGATLWDLRQPSDVLMVTDHRLVHAPQGTEGTELWHRGISLLKVENRRTPRGKVPFGTLVIGSSTTLVHVHNLPYPRRVASVLSRLRDENAQQVIILEREGPSEPPLPAVIELPETLASYGTPAFKGSDPDGAEASFALHFKPRLLRGAPGLFLSVAGMFLAGLLGSLYALIFGRIGDEAIFVLIATVILGGAFALAVLTKPVLHRMRGRLTLTREGLQMKTVAHSRDILYGEIRDIWVTQSPLQKRFGTGNVHISTKIPTAPLEMPWMMHAGEIARVILELKAADADNRRIIIVRRDPPTTEGVMGRMPE